MNYFIFNKETDYIRGFFDACVYDGQTLRLKQGFKEGTFFSRLMDSREKGTIWHRITLDAGFLGAASVQMFFYASEERTLLYRERQWDVEELIKTGELSPEDKKEAFAPYLKKKALGVPDLLLHEVKGRYVWFALGLFGQGEESPSICKMQLFFPMESWISYLPSVYRTDEPGSSFLERYLGIFQTIYEEFEQEIRHSASYLDAGTEREEFLRWMAGWLDIESTYLWTGEKLRELLRHAARLFRSRGTRRGLLEMLALYTGETPILVEQFEVEEYRRNGEKGECIQRLYGTDPNSFLLLIPERLIPSPREYEAIMRLVRELAPAHMQVRIVSMKSILYLGDYSYLGINSRLGHYRPLRLDGHSLLPFTAIAGVQGETK